MYPPASSSPPAPDKCDLEAEPRGFAADKPAVDAIEARLIERRNGVFQVVENGSGELDNMMVGCRSRLPRRRETAFVGRRPRQMQPKGCGARPPGRGGRGDRRRIHAAERNTTFGTSAIRCSLTLSAMSRRLPARRCRLRRELAPMPQNRSNLGATCCSSNTA